MPNPFSFMTATEILFGRGQAEQTAEQTAALGERVLLVHGATPSRSEWLTRDLTRAGCALTRFAVPREPDMALIEAGVTAAREVGAEVVIAIGGGAVIDTGKAIAALVPATRPMLDHLEVVGQGLPLDRAPLPFIALPTTAGTGAEVTRNAVIGVPEHRRKVSLRDPRMLPRLAIIDPELTDGCPRAVTLASGLDAITQVIEPFVSPRANAFTDALCRDTIPRGIFALKRLMEGEEASARDEMAWVSLCGGLALANAGLGAVHGLAGPLGGLTGAAHGVICGALLPHVLVANWRAVADPCSRDRLDTMAAWISAAFSLPDRAGMEEAADQLAMWSRAQGLPSLAAMGVTADVRAQAVEAAVSSSSMRANPVPLTVEQLTEIMEAAG